MINLYSCEDFQKKMYIQYLVGFLVYSQYLIYVSYYCFIIYKNFVSN